jgi:lipopolysaccharide export system protein LptC
VGSLAIASDTGPRGTHDYVARGRADGARMFRAAVRHSRLVKTLRVGIPIAVLAAAAAFALSTWLNPLRMLAALPGSLAGVVISGTKVKMESPRLAGFTQDARAYELVARSAQQDLRKPDLVELQDVVAKVEMPDKDFLNLTARSGLYDSKKDMLSLSQDIVLKMPAYDALLSEAMIDVRAGNVVSEKPVEVRMLQGVLNAGRMEIINSGEVARFGGGVIVDLEGKAFRGAAKTGAP